MHTAAAGIIPFQEEAQKKHDPSSDTKNYEGVDICQRSRLRLQRSINPRVRNALGVVPAEPAILEVLRHCAGCVDKIGIIDPRVLNQP